MDGSILFGRDASKATVRLHTDVLSIHELGSIFRL